MKKLVENHKAKVAAAAGGGFSLCAAMWMFVSVQAFDEHKVFNSETHRQVQDLDAKLDNLMMFMATGNVSTNGTSRGRVPQ